MPAEWIGEVEPSLTPTAEGAKYAGWWKSSIALGTTKDWQGLVEWCLTWMKSEPEDARIWFSLGFGHANLKRYNDSIEAYRQVIRIDPKYADFGPRTLFAGAHVRLMFVPVKIILSADCANPS